MTNWLPNLIRNGTPLYIEIADQIERDIDSGRLPSGARLPPVRNVAFDIGVTNGTVSRAYKLACERGLVSGEVGRGTYVLAKSDRIIFDMDLVTSDRAPQNKTADGNGEYGPTHYHFGYSSAVDVGQTEIIAATSRAIANGHPSKVMDYIRHIPDEWRQAGAKWLATSDWAPEPVDVIPTNGAHAAVVSIISALTAPGDKIAFESLTYCSIARSAALLGRRVVQVEFDKEGIIPASFEKVCAQQHPKILYLMPSVQNPTLACLPTDRRKEIAEIAHRYNVWIIDDSIYAPLVDDLNLPFSAIAPELTFRVGGFSKS
ncbi:MAG: PLP-dependent aminotransferase family protein, partial [Salaquimonas sp.]